MSKAEQRALEKYPFEDNSYDADSIIAARISFVDGYNQAEKDLELTWDDISVLNCLLNEVEQEFKKGWHEDRSYKGYCQEVLKRFKEKRDEL